MSRKTNRKQYSVQKRRSSILPRILVILWLLVIVVAILLIKEVPLVEILAEARAITPSTLEQETTETPNVGIPEYTQAIEYSETPDHTQITEYSQTPEYTQTPEYSQTPENTQEEVATITPESSPASLSPAEQYKYAIANRKPDRKSVV